jgi:pyruvate formate lyase activating enzyme
MKKKTCDRCFRECQIPLGGVGACLNIGNEGGEIKLLTHGVVSTLAIGPIEDKGVFHFLPGGKTLSVGAYGCNLKCKFCQNFEISQFSGNNTRMTPEEIVQEALTRGAKAVALTYSEPTVVFEFAMDIFSEAAKAGLPGVLKTNGLCRPDLFLELASAAGALNIDFKGTPEFYEKICGVSSKGLAQLHDNFTATKHLPGLEVTFLVRGGHGAASLQTLFSLVGKDVPVHLMGIVPDYMMQDATPPRRREMQEVREEALKLFSHVYDHSPGAQNDTSCRGCGSILVRREGVTVVSSRMNENRCPDCGLELWECDMNTCVDLARKCLK